MTASERIRQARQGKCVTLNGRHIWERQGLDIRHDSLKRKRRCSCCGAVKWIAY